MVSYVPNESGLCAEGISIGRSSIIYLSLALMLSFYHFETINLPFATQRAEFHQGIIRGDFKAPYQYRVLAPWLVELPALVVASVIDTSSGNRASLVREVFYSLQRVVALFLLFVVFHLFLLTWFRPDIAFAGTLILAGLHLFTYRSYYFQPSSPLNLLFLTIGAWLMARGELKGWLYPLTVIGGLTRETFGLIVPIHLSFFGLKRTTWKHTVGLFSVWAAVQIGLRGIFGMRPSFPSRPLSVNFHEVLWPLFLFSLMWVVPLIGFRRLPPELRSMLWLFAMPLLLANFIFGKVEETRLFLDLAIVLIPSTLFVLLGDQNRAELSVADV